MPLPMWVLSHLKLVEPPFAIQEFNKIIRIGLILDDEIEFEGPDEGTNDLKCSSRSLRVFL